MPEEVSREQYRQMLTGEHAGIAGFRRSLKRVPRAPRCKLCAAPFEGIGGAVLRHMGFGRFPGNPALCNNCIGGFRKMGVTGAEISVTMLFADVRGSTGIGERLTGTEFHDFLANFYEIASDTILRYDGLVDKVVGDEVIGLFFGGITGPAHAAAGIDAAIELLKRTERPDATPQGPIPIGAGLHTGQAYVGATGPAGAVDDFTALGDPVNTTARLASAAAAGELLISCAVLEAAGRDTALGDSRTVEVRGRHEPIEVIAVRPAELATKTP